MPLAMACVRMARAERVWGGQAMRYLQARNAFRERVDGLDDLAREPLRRGDSLTP
jgi:hypothetical protein